MGMSASQATLLSLTARMHDLEYQAQALDETKLEISNDSNAAYEKYESAMGATKYQLKVMTTDGSSGNTDVTYTALTNCSGSTHSMYVITDSKTNNIYLPEAVTKAMNNSIPSSVDDFLQLVASKYLYVGQNLSATDMMSKMGSDGSKTYWSAVYYQLTGYTSDSGNIVNGHGYSSISASDAGDRSWIKDQLDNGNITLNKMEDTDDYLNSSAVNIFAQSSLSTDTDFSEAADTDISDKAEVEYEHAMDLINQKDKNLDVQLSQIETEHNALKTEYDTVQDLVKKDIERSYKTFNA